MTSIPPSSHSLSDLIARPKLLPSKALIETVFKNGIKVFRNTSTVKQISDLVAEYPLIWDSQGFIRILSKRWMKVLLKTSWEMKISAIKLRVYPFSNNVWQFVDNTFNNMQKQGRQEFTTDPTLFSFRVFVVWKSDSDGKSKSRTLVDICKLNDLMHPNSYLLPL